MLGRLVAWFPSSSADDDSASFLDAMLLVQVMLKAHPRSCLELLPMMLMTLREACNRLVTGGGDPVVDEKRVHAFVRSIKILTTPKFRVAMKKHTSVLLGHLLESYQSMVHRGAEVKRAFVEAIYLVLDVAGEHEKECVMASLEPRGKLLLRKIHTDFTKYHKFAGKI